MSVSTERITALLGRLNFCLHIGDAEQRAGAYLRACEDATRGELIALTAVLSEGNAFGADAARKLAGAVR